MGERKLFGRVRGVGPLPLVACACPPPFFLSEFMESVESVLDDDKIEEVFGGAGHSKATRASRVTAARLQKAQLEEATAQVEELRRQVSTLTDAGEDSYSSALAFSPARTRAAARRPPPSPGGNQEGIPAEGGDPVTEPEAEPDGVHFAVGGAGGATGGLSAG